MIETSRLMLRPWSENDAESLFKYAQDPAVGPAGGWPHHKSVEESREIIRSVFSAPEVYAVVLKETGEPVGSCGIIFPENSESASRPSTECEIGYWIGQRYWGLGLIPEAVNALIKRCFEELNLSTLLISFYDGNHRSHRVAEKCGFIYDHTEKDQPTLLGDLRTVHFYKLSKNGYDKTHITTKS